MNFNINQHQTQNVQNVTGTNAFVNQFNNAQNITMFQQQAFAGIPTSQTMSSMTINSSNIRYVDEFSEYDPGMIALKQKQGGLALYLCENYKILAEKDPKTFTLDEYKAFRNLDGIVKEARGRAQEKGIYVRISSFQSSSGQTSVNVDVNVKTPPNAKVKVNDVEVTEKKKYRFFIGGVDVTDKCNRTVKSIEVPKKVIKMSGIDVTDICKIDGDKIMIGTQDVTHYCKIETRMEKVDTVVIYLGEADVTKLCEVREVQQ